MDQSVKRGRRPPLSPGSIGLGNSSAQRGCVNYLQTIQVQTLELCISLQIFQNAQDFLRRLLWISSAVKALHFRMMGTFLLVSPEGHRDLSCLHPFKISSSVFQKFAIYRSAYFSSCLWRDINFSPASSNM